MSKAALARSDSTQKRVAKVFASMQARDAAHILQQMDNADVKVILGSLSPKQQAAILGQFPSQRAADLARETLRNAGDNL
jgi:flagellar motility protein MotE (MotC chaperone)